MSDTANKVREAIARSLGVSVDALASNPKFDELAADSLDMFEAVMEVEDCLEVELDEHLEAFQITARVNDFVDAAVKAVEAKAA